jgi:Flp pilus assembly protein TadG
MNGIKSFRQVGGERAVSEKDARVRVQCKAEPTRRVGAARLGGTPVRRRWTPRRRVAVVWRGESASAGRRRRERRGAALVEAVIIIPVLLVLVIGFIQFSSMYFTRHAMLHAAREGARALSVQDATTAQAEQRTRDVLAGLGYDPAEFQVSGSETTTDGTIAVAISASDASIIGDPFGWMGDGTLTAAALMRDEER